MRVRATDEDDRTGDASLSLHVHTENLKPTGQMLVSCYTPRVGEQIDVAAYGFDHDGAVARIDLDLDGDGALRVQQPMTDGQDYLPGPTTTFADRGGPHAALPDGRRRRGGDRGHDAGGGPRGKPGADRVGVRQPDIELRAGEER